MKTRLFQFLVIASLLLASGAAPIQVDTASKVQPQLAQLADEQPQAQVRVIAQMMADARGAEALVSALGGRVTQDLQIINAFAAEMTAESAVELAHSGSVRWVSLDAPMESAGQRQSPSNSSPPALPNFYLDSMRVRDVWAMGVQGQGIGVAVIDSGIANDVDFGKDATKRLIWQASFNSNSNTPNDFYGHGTHVAGIIGGEGADSGGFYMGVAPKANLISLKVNDETGMAYESDVVAAMQWVYNNKAKYSIRVVNLSLNSTVESSYHASPMNAAAEILWFNGIVVVASSGNKGAGGVYNTANAAPANDPFILSVGAVDEKGTLSTTDDTFSSYTAWGTSTNGYFVPNIMAPGSNIYSVLSKHSSWAATYPDRTVLNGEYFRLSGTSMAAPMVTGAVALLLQDEPNLTPDQVKYRLLNNSGRNVTLKVGSGGTLRTYYLPYLDVYAIVTGTSTQSANQGLLPSQLLTTGTQPIAWGSVGWNSVGWNSVGWNSVGWNSVGWNSVGWNSTFWGP